MKKLMDWVTNRLSPMLAKWAHNPWLAAVQESMVVVMPITLVGSFCTLFSILSEWVPGLPDLSMLSQFTFGLMSVFISYQIPERVLEKKKHRRIAKEAGMAGLALFFILMAPQFDEDFNFIVDAMRFGNAGMLCALAAGLYSAFIFNLFASKSWFKNTTDGIPDFIKVWFDVLLPVVITVLTGYILVYVLGINVFDGLIWLFSPVTNTLESFLGYVLFNWFINGFLYSFGISTWVLFPIMSAAGSMGLSANMQAVASGLTATRVYNGVNDALFLIGGGACTLAVNIMFCLAKSKKLKTVGRAAIVPSIFEINEPIIYGGMAFEPLMMIPMWIISFIAPAVVYIAIRSGFVLASSAPFDFWYAPFPILAYGVSPCIGSIIVAFLNFGLSALVYYPFFKAYDKQQVEAEKEKA